MEVWGGGRKEVFQRRGRQEWWREGAGQDGDGPGGAQ